MQSPPDCGVVSGHIGCPLAPTSWGSGAKPLEKAPRDQEGPHAKKLCLKGGPHLAAMGGLAEGTAGLLVQASRISSLRHPFNRALHWIPPASRRALQWENRVLIGPTGPSKRTSNSTNCEYCNRPVATAPGLDRLRTERELVHSFHIHVLGLHTHVQANCIKTVIEQKDLNR